MNDEGGYGHASAIARAMSDPNWKQVLTRQYNSYPPEQFCDLYIPKELALTPVLLTDETLIRQGYITKEDRWKLPSDKPLRYFAMTTPRMGATDQEHDDAVNEEIKKMRALGIKVTQIFYENPQNPNEGVYMLAMPYQHVIDVDPVELYQDKNANIRTDIQNITRFAAYALNKGWLTEEQVVTYIDSTLMERITLEVVEYVQRTPEPIYRAKAVDDDILSEADCALKRRLLTQMSNRLPAHGELWMKGDDVNKALQQTGWAELEYVNWFDQYPVISLDLGRLTPESKGALKITTLKERVAAAKRLSEFGITAGIVAVQEARSVDRFGAVPMSELETDREGEPIDEETARQARHLYNLLEESEPDDPDYKEAEAYLKLFKKLGSWQERDPVLRSTRREYEGARPVDVLLPSGEIGPAVRGARIRHMLVVPPAVHQGQVDVTNQLYFIAYALEAGIINPQHARTAWNRLGLFDAAYADTELRQDMARRIDPLKAAGIASYEERLRAQGHAPEERRLAIIDKNGGDNGQSIEARKSAAARA